MNNKKNKNKRKKEMKHSYDDLFKNLKSINIKRNIKSLRKRIKNKYLKPETMSDAEFVDGLKKRIIWVYNIGLILKRCKTIYDFDNYSNKIGMISDDHKIKKSDLKKLDK